MQAATTCRARARAPVGLTAPRARTHRVKAFAAPTTVERAAFASLEAAMFSRYRH